MAVTPALRGPARRADTGTYAPHREARRPRLRRWLYALIAAALTVLAWQLGVDSGIVSRAGVASPTDVARAAPPLLGTSTFWSAIAATLQSWAEGLAISLMVTIPVGLVLGASELAYIFTRFSIDFLRTIPPVALVPLVLLLYGATNMMAVVLIVFGSMWPLLLQTMYGVHQVDPVARDVAHAYRLRRRDVVLRIVVPSAAPFIATGIRISATMSLLLAVGAELIGGAPGIGAQINLAQQNALIPQMYVFIVVSALLGVTVNLALLFVERRALRWHFARHGAAR